MTSLEALNPDFRDFLLALCAARAEFLIVGAYAVSLHGHARSTGDLDVWVRGSPENAKRVRQALHAFGAPVGEARLTAEDLTRSDMVYQIGLPPRRIDLLTSIAGVTFEEAWPSRVLVPWRGQQVAFLGREALLANKQATARPKDLEDIRELERRRPPS